VGTAFGLDPGDWTGDGMNDLRFDIVNGLNGNGYAGLAATDLGPYVSRGHARAPDLLTGVTNGLGATASWVHQPLSQKDTAAAGCDMPSGSFYVRTKVIRTVRQATSTSRPRCGPSPAST